MAARTRLTLAAATTDAVMFLYLAGVWLTFGATAISHLGRVACGKGCRVVAAASGVHRLTFFPFLFLCPVALLLFTVRVARSPPETQKAPAPKNIAEALRQVLRKGNPAAPIVLEASPCCHSSCSCSLATWRRRTGLRGKQYLFAQQCCGDLGCRCSVLLPHSSHYDSVDVEDDELRALMR